MSAQFIGGKGLIDWMRGNTGKDGNYSVDEIGLILPSARTLRKCGPVSQPYDSLSLSNLEKVISGIPKCIIKTFPNYIYLFLSFYLITFPVLYILMLLLLLLLKLILRY